jgi:zinc protease
MRCVCAAAAFTAEIGMVSRFHLMAVGLALGTLLGTGGARVRAQDSSAAPAPPLSAPIPTDPDVTIGVLPNGMRYYIRENHKPEHRAELRLVVNAGSILEDSAQRGLAHLIEHMAFAGTTHFERQALVDYLESTGVRFGADLNAGTSFDETVYQLTVPTDSAKLLERGIQILEDWADGVTFDSTGLVRERRVVTEEWRLGRGAGQRIRDKQFPVLFANSRYARRLPIGDPHIIATAPRSELLRFYHDWYRPDLMAVVVVGDFDKAQVERWVKADVGQVPVSPTHRERPTFPVPDHDSTLVSVATDPEATSSNVALYYLQPVHRDSTVGDYRDGLVRALYNDMLDERLGEITQRPHAPFLNAQSIQGRLIRSKDVYELAAIVKDGGIERGLSAVLTEAARVEQHGFTATELAREKANMLRGMEQAYAERAKTSSDVFVSNYVDNYLEGISIPSLAQEWELTRALLPGITLDEVNRLASEWLADRSRVITASAPSRDSAQMPNATQLAALADSVGRTPVTAYVDSVANAPLVAHAPAPGRVVFARTVPSVGVIEWTLSNGAHVVLKPTQFKDDELLFRAFGPGGISLADDSVLVPAKTASDVVFAGGVGAFNATELDKALAGKTVSVGPYVSSYEQGVTGSGSPRDAETMLQLVYLYFTSPRADTSAFMAYQTRMKELLANRNASPGAAFSDTIEATLYQHNPRLAPFTSATTAQMNLGTSLAFYRARFANASDFTFVFVGNIDTTTLKPLIEQYIGGLPSSETHQTWRDVGIDFARGAIHRAVHRGAEPKSNTDIIYSGPLAFSRHSVYELQALEDVLEIRLRQRLREKLGGTYGVNVIASPTQFPRPRYEVAITFGSAPDRVTELVRAARAELDSIKTYGPTAADLEKVRETELRERETGLTQNGFWLTILHSYLYNKWNLDDILAFKSEIRGLTAAAVRDAARTYLNERNVVQVSLFPQLGASR